MRYLYIALILLLAFKINAQIAWLEPTNPKPSDRVTLYFDVTKGNAALKDYDGKVYMHTGVITDKSLDGGDWKHVVGNWGEDDERVKMTDEGNGIYSISFVMKDFYNLRDDETPKMLAFVFRSENGGLVGKTKTNEDIFIPVNDYVIPQKQKAAYLFEKRLYVSHFKYGNTLKILTTKGLVELMVYTDKIIEVRHFDKSIESEVNSDAVIMKPEETFSEISDSEEQLVLNINDLEVIAHKDPFYLSFEYKGKEVLKEERGYFKREDNNGLRFSYDKNEQFFGLGERANSFNLVGSRYKLYNRPKYGYEYGARNINYSIPLVVSSKKYLLLFDNPQKGYADIGETEDGILEWGAIGGLMKYFVVVGDDFKDVMQNYGELTGKQPLPPLWALGNLQSRMAYRTQYETDSIVSLIQKNDFPLDAVILDFYWFGDSILGTMGRLKWYKPNWPEPEKMISDFKKKGVKTILITEPYILDSLENFKIADSLGILAKDSLGNSLVNKEFYFGDGALIDIFKPSAQDWFWHQYQKQIEKGVAGWWGDLGEPENHPSDQIHVNGMADEVHNIYGHYWHKMLFENYRKYYPNKRLFNLNRAGYAGSQRYSIYPWTGDVARSWGGLKAQIPLMLNMSMSGLPFIHSDAGGFAQGTKDDELYTRWLQMACFSPILRPHGSGIPSEAVYFNDTTQSIVRKYMKLRYSLLPYIYDVAATAHINGYPIIRPMLFAFPDDSEAYKADWEYMLGESLLVVPVVEKGQDTIKVYLPKGYDWYDFHTNKKFNGGQWIKQKVELENIPIFVKSGSFVSMVEAVNTTDNYKTDKLIVKYYLAKAESQSEQTLYLDDGKTFGNYEKGNYSELMFKSTYLKDDFELEFSTNSHKYKGMPSEREIKLVLVGYNTDKKSLGAKLIMNDGSSKMIKFKKEKKLFVTYFKQNNNNLKIDIE